MMGTLREAQPAGTRSPSQDTGKGSGREHSRVTPQRERGRNASSSDVELSFAPGSVRGGNPAATTCPRRPGAGHLCGLQGPRSSKVVGIVNAGAPSSRTGPRCCFVCRGEPRVVPPQPGDVLSQIPKSPQIFLTGTGGQSSGSLQGGQGLVHPGKLQMSPNRWN